MRLRVALIPIAVGLLALPGSAVGSHDPSGEPRGEDFVAGSGTMASGSPTPGDDLAFDIETRGGPQGQDPTGFATMSLRQNLLGGSVSCLHAEGRRATMVGDSPTLAVPYLIVVEDNAGTGRPDLFGAVNLFGRPPVDCVTDTTTPSMPIISGDLVVHDGLGTPATTGQCKGGGWRTFGSFVNQGACVRFVTHQARQECIFIRAAHGGPAFRTWYGTPVGHWHAMRRCTRQRSDD